MPEKYNEHLERARRFFDDIRYYSQQYGKLPQDNPDLDGATTFRELIGKMEDALKAAKTEDIQVLDPNKTAEQIEAVLRTALELDPKPKRGTTIVERLKTPAGGHVR